MAHFYRRFTSVLLLILLSLFFLHPATPASLAQSGDSSQLVTWTCTASPCPWGDSVSGQALVWPAAMGPLSNRLGYTTSAPIYLPAGAATDLSVAITSGTATVYAGLPDADSHRVLATVSAGQSYLIGGVVDGEVVSVQSGSPFTFNLTSGSATPTNTPLPPTATPTNTPAGPAATPTNTPDPANTSQLVTWSCTGSPCPWGNSLSGQALVWPAAMGPVSNRLGYTTSAGIYLPAGAATDLSVAITSGTATVYAGLPDADSHRVLATVSAGQSYLIGGVVDGEVVSVQSGSPFTFNLTSGSATPTNTPLPPTATPTNTPGGPAATPTNTPDPTNNSQLVTWTCTSSPCPWGNSLSGQALVWPAAMGPVSNRLGYTTSAPIYLPAGAATDLSVAITSGTATVYAGLPDADSHRVLATVSAGQSYLIGGVVDGEVVSVQSGSPFTFNLSTTPPGTATVVPPSPTPDPNACTDPLTCNPVTSIPALWRCDIPECSGADWVGSVIAWPSNTAYPNNARSGDNSRTVYSFQDEPLYPYMPGSWAQGCQVTVVSGTVVIIEWQRGTNVWRATQLVAGQSYTINLVSPEDGAMIEGLDNLPFPSFSVSLSNCTPQPIPGAPTPTVTPVNTAQPTNTPVGPTATNTPVAPTATNTPVATSTPLSATPTNTPLPPTATPTNPPLSQRITVRVSNGNDDAEERSSGSMYLDSSDLELVQDGSQLQTVGLRFQNVTIPAGATIANAYIEFEVDEASSESTSLTIAGQATGSAPAFTSSTGNISGRSRTSATIAWSNLPAWSSANARWQTPNLAPIVQEIVNQSGWANGNAMAFIITGSGRRVAEAYEGESSAAPLLVIEYTAGGTLPTPTPTPVSGQAVTSFTLVNADTDQDITTLSNGATLNLATLPTRNLNIRANTNPATVGSVLFTLNGSNVRIENTVPYALGSDDGNGNYAPWTPAVGSHTLTAIPYTGSSAGGTAGTSLTISFSVIDQTQAPTATNTPVATSTPLPPTATSTPLPPTATPTAVLLSACLAPSQDSYVRQDSATNNYGGENDLKVKPDSGKQHRALIQFNLATIPANSTVRSATLYLYEDNTRSNQTIFVHQVTNSWVGSQVTWNSRSNGTAWNSTGGDFASTALLSFSPNLEKQYRLLDVTGMTQQWVNGTASNNGLLLRSSGDNGEVKFKSVDDGTAERRPQLCVSYTEPQAPASGSGPAVTSFTLVNADTDQDIGSLSNGATLNLATLPTRNLNIRANTNPATVGSVLFRLNGSDYRIENVVPYALGSDNGSGDYAAMNFAVGQYTLSAIPYSGSSASGTAGASLAISFSVIDPNVDTDD